jgi:DNA-binding SARP family transcriptional activator
VEIRLLGHTSLDGGVVVTRPLERALLARLALARGGPVSPEQLVVDLWGVGDGSRPTERLRVVVSRLRGALGQHANLVQRVPAGYRTPVVPVRPGPGRCGG